MFGIPIGKTIWLMAGVLAAGGVGVVGYRVLRADLAAQVYRDRLEALAGDYEVLRARYNQAVKRTAVTELVVADRKLTVRIRNSEGVVREIPTPYDPAGEIYVDYVIVDGRLWIRRVFDLLTPPASGLVVDPELGSVDWDDPAAAYGKAVYRSLSEGRWVISVTGDGSLGLTLADEASEIEFVPAPPVRDFERIEKELAEDLGAIAPGDIVRRLVRGG